MRLFGKIMLNSGSSICPALHKYFLSASDFFFFFCVNLIDIIHIIPQLLFFILYQPPSKDWWRIKTEYYALREDIS